MAKDREQIMKELEALKGEVQNLKVPSKDSPKTAEEGVETLMKYMIEERERTNKKLEEINTKIARLRGAIESMYEAPVPADASQRGIENKEIPLSELDSEVLDFIDTKEMVCADDLRKFMNYRGRNGACARLSLLYKQGLLVRHQLGHKVYYKYAGKATNTLIISPPQ